MKADRYPDRFVSDRKISCTSMCDRPCLREFPRSLPEFIGTVALVRCEFVILIITDLLAQSISAANRHLSFPDARIGDSDRPPYRYASEMPAPRRGECPRRRTLTAQ